MLYKCPVPKCPVPPGLYRFGRGQGFLVRRVGLRLAVVSGLVRCSSTKVAQLWNSIVLLLCGQQGARQSWY